MKIHHLNCGTMYPPMNHWIHGIGTFRNRPPLVTHCLLVESDGGLLLVDTGFGRRDLTTPTPFVRFFMNISSFGRDPAETAHEQIQRLGYRPQNVQHIAVTHMHLDHVGGITDFPDARVHLYAREYDAIRHPQTIEEKFIARPEHWAHEPKWVIHETQGKDWFGFDSTPEVNLGQGGFFFVPLVGHTRGHSAVVIHTPDGWLVHCGDSYVYHGEVDPDQPYFPPQHKTTLKIMGIFAQTFRALGTHSSRLRHLLRDHGDSVKIFCSHDPAEFACFSGAPIQFYNTQEVPV